jgi:acyl carrier protein
MKDEIIQIIAATFSVQEKEINNDVSANDLEHWNSLNHFNLVVALEEKYKITFSLDDVVSLVNVQNIIDTVEKKTKGL